jgi:hypothetical protein
MVQALERVDLGQDNKEELMDIVKNNYPNMGISVREMAHGSRFVMQTARNVAGGFISQDKVFDIIETVEADIKEKLDNHPELGVTPLKQEGKSFTTKYVMVEDLEDTNLDYATVIPNERILHLTGMINTSSPLKEVGSMVKLFENYNGLPNSRSSHKIAQLNHYSFLEKGDHEINKVDAARIRQELVKEYDLSRELKKESIRDEYSALMNFTGDTLNTPGDRFTIYLARQEAEKIALTRSERKAAVREQYEMLLDSNTKEEELGFRDELVRVREAKHLAKRLGKIDREIARSAEFEVLLTYEGVLGHEMALEAQRMAKGRVERDRAIIAEYKALMEGRNEYIPTVVAFRKAGNLASRKDLGQDAIRLAQVAEFDAYMQDENNPKSLNTAVYLAQENDLGEKSFGDAVISLQRAYLNKNDLKKVDKLFKKSGDHLSLTYKNEFEINRTEL